MSSTSALECNEDLENVTLVRMEDVQPDRSSDVYVLATPTYVNSIIDHDYSCVFDDEESNIGSMVSIHSEDVEDFIENQDKCKTSEFFASNPDSWPTLEILPGGVIKHSEKFITSLHQQDSEEKEMMYACAKCPQRFKFLYNLVKHVKLHEVEKKKILELKQKVEAKAEKAEARAIKLKKKRKERRKYLKSMKIKEIIENKT